jgi:hypothetical protein
MVQTRKRAARAPASDDEAPEEVPRADSKRQAKAAAEQEQEAAAAAAAAAASRRSRKAAVKEADAPETPVPATSPPKRQRRGTTASHKQQQDQQETEEQQQEGNHAAAAASPAPGPGSTPQAATGGGPDTLDLLPQDVLAALAAHRWGLEACKEGERGWTARLQRRGFQGMQGCMLVGRLYHACNSRLCCRSRCMQALSGLQEHGPGHMHTGAPSSRQASAAARFHSTTTNCMV